MINEVKTVNLDSTKVYIKQLIKRLQHYKWTSFRFHEGIYKTIYLCVDLVCVRLYLGFHEGIYKTNTKLFRKSFNKNI